MKRYKVTTVVEMLEDPDSWINPESGKVEPRTVCIRDGLTEVVSPPWREVARFGSGVGVDAETFVAAMPGLVEKINEGYAEVQKLAPLVDRDALVEQPQ